MTDVKLEVIGASGVDAPVAVMADSRCPRRGPSIAEEQCSKLEDEMPRCLEFITEEPRGPKRSREEQEQRLHKILMAEP